MRLHEHFLRSRLRTRDPGAATLFFIPAYLGRLFNWFWQRPHCDEEGAPPPPMCREEQVNHPCVHQQKMGSVTGAAQSSSDVYWVTGIEGFLGERYVARWVPGA